MRKVNIYRRMYHTVGFQIKALLFTLVCLTGARLALLISAHHLLAPESQQDIALQSQAFLIGMQFDHAVCCYLSALPLLLAVVMAFFPGKEKGVLCFSKYWLTIGYTLIIGLQIANIPYFLYFSKNLNASIWNWLGDASIVLGMIAAQPSYLLTGLLIVLLAAAVYKLMDKLYRQALKQVEGEPVPSTPKQNTYAAIIGILLLGLCFLGIRGKEIKPLNVGFTYYCTDAFLNQLGANATYNLAFSTRGILNPSTKTLHLMDADEALKKAQAYLHRGKTPEDFLTFTTAQDSLHQKKNVVLILMESMSAGLLQTFGQKESYTPFLDSLYRESISFRNCYSAGLHTNNGIFSTLTSVPSLMYGNLMRNDAEPPLYQCLPQVLKEQGYKTLFFITHESHFDNLNTFLYNHHIDELYEEKDYPEQEILTRFGPPDESLFRLGLEKLGKTREPFMATLLTITNHPPFKFPSTFHGTAKTQELQAVQYADYCLERFFKEARKQAWYENTLFVLIADHGKSLGTSECEIPADFNHIPLLFFQPGKHGEERTQWAMQIDVQPTILGLLGMKTEQNHFGIDLLKESRPYAYYSADDKIAIRDSSHLLIYEPATKKEFRYTVKDTKTLKPAEDNKDFKAMREYLFCMFQAAQMAVDKGGTKKNKNSFVTLEKK